MSTIEMFKSQIAQLEATAENKEVEHKSEIHKYEFQIKQLSEKLDQLKCKYSDLK